MRPSSDERVLITLFDKKPEEIGHLPTGYKDSKEDISFATYIDEKGCTRVLDAVAHTRAQRWWKVVMLCRAEGQDTVPIYYDGPASDIPARFLRRRDQEDVGVALIRLANRGPWCELTRQEPVPPEASDGGIS